MSSNWEDSHLKRFHEGDHHVFSGIYTEFKARIYGFCLKKVRIYGFYRDVEEEKRDAEDITADTFAALWHHR